MHYNSFNVYIKVTSVYLKSEKKKGIGIIKTEFTDLKKVRERSCYIDVHSLCLRPDIRVVV